MTMLSFIETYHPATTSKKMLGLFAVTASMAGCATLGGGLTPTQCQQSNWQTIGYQDGLLGRSQDYIQKHIKQCAKANTTPNQQQWRQGREEGLKRYCTPLRAYQLGREGYDYNDVCPQSMTLDLLKAHDEGYLNYQREQRLNQLWYNTDPFWGSPFYGSRFGGWGGLERGSRPYYPRIAPNNRHPKYSGTPQPTSSQPVAPSPVTPSNDANIGSKK